MLETFYVCSKERGQTWGGMEPSCMFLLFMCYLVTFKDPVGKATIMRKAKEGLFVLVMVFATTKLTNSCEWEFNACSWFAFCATCI
ncbi:hypothetical protein DUNSADRAFT_9614 [Dunaliella salina]|uniref:Uncharacterized protein n=1 Tax=Dunaliella salina TaxID=3046 RepID=A0ABQ7H5B3_DUNSA|nr:hypothetical protein DUNSADRAFT_9614 [Dunaliella salina]|eukprot:KAF5842045.1 hypothetical protein DUNSADRAFT_9614 [Dunaliella salina]